MKHSFDEDRSSHADERSNHTFGRAELYLLLLLFVGGSAIDSWFHHRPLSFGRSLIKQHQSGNSVPDHLLL